VGRQRSFSSAAASDAVPSACTAHLEAWMKGAQSGMRPEDTDIEYFFERLHKKMIARNPPRRVRISPQLAFFSLLCTEI